MDLARLAALVILLSWVGSPASAQDDRQPPEPPPQRPAVTDDALKRELEDRFAQTERQQARIRRALAILREGGSREDLAVLLRDIRESAGDRWAGFRPEAVGDRSLRGPGRGEPGRGGEGRPGEGRPEGGPAGRAVEAQPITLTPEQIAEIIAFLREHAPEFADRIERIRAQNPEIEQRMVARFAPLYLEFLDLMRENPEAAELKVREFRVGASIMRAMGEVRGATFAQPQDPERLARAVEDLRKLIGEQFEIRLALHENEIAVLRERVARLEGELSQERAEREARVAKKVEEILSDIRRREPRERRDRP